MNRQHRIHSRQYNGNEVVDIAIVIEWAENILCGTPYGGISINQYRRSLSEIDGFYNIAYPTDVLICLN